MRLNDVIMKCKILNLLLSWLLWLAVFAVGKVGFMLYNSGEHPFAAGDVLDVLLHGLSMDMSRRLTSPLCLGCC